MKTKYLLILIYLFTFFGCKHNQEPIPKKPTIYGAMKGIVILNGHGPDNLYINQHPVLNLLCQLDHNIFMDEDLITNKVKYNYARSGGGVKVSLKNGDFRATTFTDTNGLYQFDKVPIGVSNITFTKSGYGTYPFTVTLTGGGQIPVRNNTIVMAKISSLLQIEEILNSNFNAIINNDGYLCFRKKIAVYLPNQNYSESFYNIVYSYYHLVLLSKDSLISSANFDIRSEMEGSGILSFLATFPKKVGNYRKIDLTIQLKESYLEQNFKIGDFFYIKLYGINNNSSKYYNEKGQIVEPTANEDNALLMKFEYTNKNFCKRIFKDGEIESILAKDTIR